MTILSIKDISKSFGNTKALEHVSFDVAEGEIVALLDQADVVSPPCWRLLLVWKSRIRERFSGMVSPLATPRLICVNLD